MVFSDLFFLFAFIPSFALCYLLGAWIDRKFGIQNNTAKNIMLVIFSLLFYAWGEPVYVLLMLGSVVINYFAGLVIARQEQRRKLALIIGLACNIGVLAIFKYLSFFAGILVSIGLNVPDPKIALPIGISFYTFQSISYLIDVYRRDAHVQRRYIDLLLYISMFPQLIAGPIVRYDSVAKEINDRHVSVDDFAEGVFRFLIGLGKKVIIANQFSEIADQFLVDDFANLTTFGAWVGILAFTLQIYFDFSGYSDMAIGMGRCLGFHFNENFDHPYIARSITEFWRRWHMSLGSFFRDYVYIPMGGNRRHQALNIFVVWFLTGMWHGACWNFIIWGLYFGLILSFEKFTLKKVQEKVPACLMRVYTLFIVIAGMGIFYFTDFSHLGKFFCAFFGGSMISADIVAQSALLDNFWLWVVAVIFCMPVRRWTTDFFTKKLADREDTKVILFTSTRIVISLALLIISVALLVGATNNAFIYTRF